VIRDKRKIDPTGRPKGEESTAGESGGEPGTDQPGRPVRAATDQAATDQAVPDEGGTTEAEGLTDADVEEIIAGEVITGGQAEPVPTGFAAELASLRSELDERLRDLQRVTAEYANYRKRVDRDRSAVVEQATGTVVTALLPILDDLDRAREHDDLVGPTAAMAEQLSAVLAKFGLTAFGEPGDAFDPTRHEAVAHQTSAEVTEPTCVAVMRRGYLLGDRLLRAALVGVADPE
jgi:molecular chaperone GrpE